MFLALLLGSAAPVIPQEADTAPPVMDAMQEYPLIHVSKEHIADVGYWQDALTSAPDDITLQLALGNAYALNRRFNEAAQEYQKVLRAYPEYKAAWNNLGSAYRAMGKMNDALGAYKKAVAQDPRYGLAYYNIGAVYDHMGYYDKALKNYSLAIKYDPTLTDSRKNPQVVTNKRLYAVLLQNYVESAGSLALPLEPAYPENPNE